MKEKFNSYLYMVSASLLLFAAAFYIINPYFTPYVFAIGAAGVAISRLNLRYGGKNMRVKRLYRMQKLGGLVFVAASYFMFQPHNQWVPLLLIGAFLELYTTIAINKEEQKNQ